MCIILDRGYFDLARLLRIAQTGTFFVIRGKYNSVYEVVEGEDLLDGSDNVLQDQTVRFTRKKNREHYPSEIRHIVYYAPDLQRTFTYYANNFYLAAKDVALLYRNRWQVELFQMD